MNKLRANVEFWQMLLGIAITVGGGVYAVASTAAEAQSTIKAHTGKIDRLEQTYRDDHDTLVEMRQDIRWIRENLKK